MKRLYRKRWALVFFALFLSMVISGCQNQTVENDDQVKYLIGVSQANLGEPWRVTMNEAIKTEAAKHKDMKVIFTDAAQSNAKQIQDVKKLMQLGIDLLIISPNEAAPLTPVVSEAFHKIPVIVLDRAVEGNDYTLFIGADNRLIGKQAGQFAVDLLGPNGGNLVEIQGLPGSPPTKDRDEGFREVIAQHKNIQIVDTIVADWLRDKAEVLFRNDLMRNLKVDLVYAQNDPMALGAYKAASGLGKQIQYVGIDGLKGPNGGLQLVKSNILKGTFIYPTGGREAVQYALKILNHEENLPKKVTLSSIKITKDNVDEYLQ